MKLVCVLVIALTWLSMRPVYGQDPNVLIGLSSPAHGVTIKANFPNGTGGFARGFWVKNEDASQTFVVFGTYGHYENGQSSQYYSYIGQGHGNPYITFLPTGNIGIGTTDPQAKLAVNGNILAKEIKIKTDISVPDYVFEPDYDLATLPEVEAHIREYKHLPEIPSAADIQRDGLDLAEMNLLLLKKVEELTLHLIEREKAERQIVAELEALKRQVAADQPEQCQHGINQPSIPTNK